MGRNPQPLRLTADQRAVLHKYLQQPRLVSRQRNRAQAVLDWDAGCPVVESAERLGMTVGRVYALRRLYLRQGLEAYLNAPPHGGAPTKLTPAVEAALKALLTGPTGSHAHAWTRRQLADYLVAQGYAASICPATAGKAWQRLQALLPTSSEPAGAEAAEASFSTIS
ncbi:helix-turn-helix domain-containing protein [Hymenobacter sp. CRA2]|uniref:helix-turn-helix domain-containing protein n=1 Tax=Hymenobacter sp. CRA2 TaxID=1955620 RepID=UPI00098F6168|nr:helix-turn-helix domain-containing protein [Hymenobacter sp. CRA2]OON66046.1 hypothetical protein B0919_22690 [Hymenobacter sp. CRA2]